MPSQTPPRPENESKTEGNVHLLTCRKEILACLAWRVHTSQDLQLLFGASPGSVAVAQKELPGCGRRQGPAAEVCSACTANPCVSLAAFLQNLADLGVQLTC